MAHYAVWSNPRVNSHRLASRGSVAGNRLQEILNKERFALGRL